jgi:hypothetical protein
MAQIVLYSLHYMSSYSRYKFAYRNIVSFLSEAGDIIICTCCAILLDATVVTDPQYAVYSQFVEEG